MDDNQRAHKISTLEGQLLDVEAQLVALHQGREPAFQSPARPSVQPVSSIAPPPIPPPPAPNAPWPPHDAGGPAGPPPPASGGESRGRPTSSVSAEVLLRLGGIALLVLGAVFFVSTAISRGWIGPSAQLGLATTVSLALVAQSFRFSEDRRPWTITLAGGGATALLASGVIGYLGLDLLSFGVALGWFCAAIVAYLALSLFHRSELLAALAAPALTIGILLMSAEGGGFDGTVALIAALYLGAISAVTWRRRWHAARALGSAVGAGFALAGVMFTDAPDPVTLALAVFAVAVGLVAAVMQALDFAQVEEAPSAAARAEARLAAAFIPWAAVVFGIGVERFWDSAIEPGWTVALVGLLGVGTVTAIAHRMGALMTMLHQAAAIGTVSVGLALVLEGPALLAAVAIQAVTTVILAVRTRAPEMFMLATVLAALALGWTAVLIIVGATEYGLTLGELAVTAGVVLLIIGATTWARINTSITEAWMIAWPYLLGWFAAAWFALPQGQMAVSLSWAAVGAAMVVAGAHLRDNPIVYGGLTTLAVTAAKLILIDLAAVDVLWRAGLFVVVGALFMRLAFMLPQLASAEDTVETDGVRH